LLETLKRGFAEVPTLPSGLERRLTLVVAEKP
jgi:hypothetical protein